MCCSHYIFCLTLLYYSSCPATLVLTINPAMINVQDTSLQVQAAIKNMANNTVFYFVIPIDVEALLQSAPAIDVNTFAGSWKSLDENSEVSVVIKGK